MQQTPTKKLTFAADASSLILLHKAGMLQQLTSSCRFLATPLILNEIQRGATVSDKDIFAASVTLVAEIPAVDIDAAKKLSRADAGVLALYDRLKPDAVLSDDEAILKLCKRRGVRHFSTLSLLSLLVRRRIIDAASAFKLFSTIAQLGRYSPKIVHIAGEMLRKSASEEMSVHNNHRERSS